MTHSTSSPDNGNISNQKQRTHPAASRVKHRAKAAGVRLFSILFWLVAWHLASVVIDQELLLVSPAKAIRTLGHMLGTAEFYQAVFGSLSRILMGYALGVVLGAVLASLAYAVPLVGTLMGPMMYAVKSTPVASFVILALIFMSSRYLSILMGFLMVLPILYSSVLTGLQGTDRKLIEMAKVFRMRPGAKIRTIYLPAAYPNFLSACALSLGMGWKAGIAAEVIGLPDQSIGEALYQAKIFFSTPELFAWTLAIILISVGMEQAMLHLVGRLRSRLEGGSER